MVTWSMPSGPNSSARGGLRGIGERGLGFLDPVVVEEDVEIAIAEPLVDQPPQPVFGDFEFRCERADGEIVVAIDALLRHQAHQGVDQLLVRGTRILRNLHSRRGGRCRREQIGAVDMDHRARNRGDDAGKHRGVHDIGDLGCTVAGDKNLQGRVHAAIERGSGDDEETQAPAAFHEVGRPGRDGLRNGEHDKAERDQIDRDDCDPCVARRHQPETADEAERGHRKPDQPMPGAKFERIVKQRPAKQPEHHGVAGGQGDQRGMPERSGRCRADRASRGMRRGADCKGNRKSAAHRVEKVTQERGGEYQKDGHRGATQGDIESGKRHWSARSNARRSNQHCPQT
jgi:hypothetical protein